MKRSPIPLPRSTQAMSEAARAIGDLAKQTEKLGVLILEMKDH